MSAFWSGHACAVAGCRCRVPLHGAAAGCRCRVPLQGAAAGCYAAAGCCCRVPLVGRRLKVLLSQVCARFRAGMLVLLHGAAAVRCSRVLLSRAAGCCFRVLLSVWSVRFGPGMLVPLQGACRVPCRCRVPHVGCCLNNGVCALERACWCCWRGLLRDVYGSVGVGP